MYCISWLYHNREQGIAIVDFAALMPSLLPLLQSIVTDYINFIKPFYCSP